MLFIARIRSRPYARLYGLQCLVCRSFSTDCVFTNAHLLFTETTSGSLCYANVFLSIRLDTDCKLMFLFVFPSCLLSKVFSTIVWSFFISYNLLNDSRWSSAYCCWYLQYYYNLFSVFKQAATTYSNQSPWSSTTYLRYRVHAPTVL